MNLYRYISLNSNDKIERFFKLLNENKLYFSSPIVFNDPYDSKVNFADCSEQDILDVAKLFYKKRHTSSTHEDCQDFAQYLRELKPEFLDGKQLRAKEKEVIERGLNNSGVVCLSEINDDILMWSHYADAHKGICLVFDKEIIANDKRFILRKINYRDDNRLIPCKEFYEIFGKGYEIYDLLLLTKSLHWKYEREWRILVSAKYIENNSVDEDDKRFFICNSILTGIIFGWKFSPAFKQVIMKLVQNRPIQLYQAKRNENSYAIDVEPIIYTAL